MNAQNLSFVHRFLPAARDGSPTVLLLHGTGGNEEDLIGVGQFLAPDAALLSPRGQVLENGMPRFFRRLAEGVFDLEDLQARTHQLADFVEAAAKAYDLDPNKIIAAGYSNGANIAAAMLLLRPQTLAGAVLFHPMVPLTPPSLPDLARTPVWIGAGRRDPIVSPAQTEALAKLLQEAGADVTLFWQNGGHNLSQEELNTAKLWLQGVR